MPQLADVVALVSRVLGPDLIGAYLHGSGVLAGLRPASDVDILAVGGRSLSTDQRRALVAGLLPLSGAGVRPVELTVVVQSSVKPWRYPPVADFLYGEWLRASYEAGVLPQPEPMPGLALELNVALAGEHSLLGPPPAEVLDPVPHTDVVRASIAGLPSLVDDLEGDTRNVLLTLARVWTTLATGTIRTKDAAAAWALARLPPSVQPPLEHARRLYLTTTYADETWPGPVKDQVQPLVAAMLAEIRALTDVS
jgi:streptomycin 3"-adenylyltransferase